MTADKSETADLAPDPEATPEPETSPEELPAPGPAGDPDLDWINEFLDHHHPAGLRVNRAYPGGPWIASLGHLPHHGDRMEIAGSGPSPFHAMRELETQARAYRQAHPTK